MSSHPPAVSHYIARAQKVGSKAGTLRGAGKAILAQTRSVFRNQPPYPHNRQTTRTQWYAAQHKHRLIARYVGLRKLPRYVGPADRTILAESPANKERLKLLALPKYVRAYYLTSASDIPRLASFVRQCEAEKGVFTEWRGISEDAFNRAPWGRERKRYEGKFSLTPGIRTTDNGKWGWDKVVWHYADYTLIAPQKTRRGELYTMYYVSPDQKRHIVFVSPHYYRIDNEQPQKLVCKQSEATPLPVHIQRQLLAPHTPSVLTIQYDRTAKSLMLVDALSEQYHLKEMRRGTDAARQVREALTAFRKRRAERISTLQPEMVWVSVEDSLEAGNCRSETEKYAARLHAELGADGQLGAVRGDIILALRNDNYTRRAVGYAATRTQLTALAA